MGKKTFEQSLKELEDIIEQLESGDIPLEKALKLFEEGVSLSKFCSSKLDEVERKISVLIKDQNGNYTEKAFIPEVSHEDGSE